MMDEREHILELVESSEYHQWWGEEEFENFVEQPMRLDQYVLMDEGFATWGFPNE